MQNKKVFFLTRAALIAAVYVVLTLVFAPISFGQIQVRIAEALTILPVFTSAAVPGLFIGCLLGNIFGGAILTDIVFGSIATLIGALGTYYIGKFAKESASMPFLAALPPIVANVIAVPLILRYAYGVDLPLIFLMATIGMGEFLSCGVLGVGLYYLLRKRKNIFVYS
ncbi:MAG: QueT transporter family protein [Lachnospiraceae bacterium]|jgi:uncharacterized membrane protein|nr:QueT transporter family protein [Lachnospiraceae bacterium]